MHDVLVVGGGIAGLRAAVEARRGGARTVVLTKSHPLRSYSVTVQDGINAAMGPGDSWEEHAGDTVRSGDYLNDQEVVEEFCREAPGTLQELDAMGVPLHRTADGGFRLEPLIGSGQARAASVHDMTGHAIAQVLYEQALRAGVEFLEEWYAVSLVVDDKRCRGLVAVQLSTGKLELFSAGAVVLATGGARRLYEPSTASLLCNGDGIALAYRAGAILVDMEMVQYHPCVMKNGRLAISELLLARGAQLLDGESRPLVAVGAPPNGHSLAQAAIRSLEAGNGSDGHLLLDARITPEAEALDFSMTAARIKMFLQQDLAGDQIPVAPAMHRLLGGVSTDAHAATTIPGLMAAGECAGNGFHGAGALDGNALLASVVSGRRAGETAAVAAGDAPPGEPGRAILTDHENMRRSLMSRESTGSAAEVRGKLAEQMHRRAGLARDATSLEEASQQVQGLRQSFHRLGIRNGEQDYNFELLQHYEIGSLLDVAEVVLATAVHRQESRGVHRRDDFPHRDDAVWNKRVMVQRGPGGAVMSDQPVCITRWPAPTQTTP